MSYVCVTHIGRTYTEKDMFLPPFMVLAQVLYLYCYSSISNLSFFSFLSPSLSLFFSPFLLSISLPLSFLLMPFSFYLSYKWQVFVCWKADKKLYTWIENEGEGSTVLPKARFIFLAFYILNNASLF